MACAAHERPQDRCDARIGTRVWQLTQKHLLTPEPGTFRVKSAYRSAICDATSNKNNAKRPCRLRTDFRQFQAAARSATVVLRLKRPLCLGHSIRSSVTGTSARWTRPWVESPPVACIPAAVRAAISCRRERRRNPPRSCNPPSSATARRHGRADAARNTRHRPR